MNVASGVAVGVLTKVLADLCLKGLEKIKESLAQKDQEVPMITEEEAQILKENHGIIEAQITK